MGSATKNLDTDSFAKQAAGISKAEIELGQLALESSKDESVRKFAQKMVTDHTASAAKLKAAAKKDNVPLPEGLDAKHKATKEKLASLSGEAFDREYVKAMSKGHDEALALFESASQSTKVSSDLKQFASSSLPTLREHRELAHSLHSKKGG
jgi:putative membrane protein